jgi:S-adenosylmethionine/arginine decarboxylase-like enzyme
MQDNYKPQPPGACEACDSMWREYAHAMAEHLRIQLDVYMATTGRDWDRETALNTLLNAAESRRNAARATIRAHEDSAHIPPVQ